MPMNWCGGKTELTVRLKSNGVKMQRSPPERPMSFGRAGNQPRRKAGAPTSGSVGAELCAHARSNQESEKFVKNPPPATSLTIPNPQDFWYNRKTMLDSAAPRQKNDRPVIPRPRFRFRVGLGIFMLLLLAAGVFIGSRL